MTVQKPLESSRPRMGLRWSVVASLLLLLTLALVTGCRRETEGRRFDVQVLFEAADIIAKHADSMDSLGKRMVEHGQKVNNRNWIADGQHWQTDANDLKQHAKKIRTVATDLQGNPILAKEVNIREVIADGQTIVGEGKAVTEHGKVMVELSSVMLRSAREVGDAALLADAEEATLRSKDFIEAGERITKAGQALIDFGEEMLRSIGRG